MQLARNISLSPEQTFIRKFKEMLLALKIEQELTKDEILELYFNLVPFGKRAYGAQAAAMTYYGAPLNQLDLAQLAMLAGIPQAPTAGNPINGPERAMKRRNLVLARMLDQGSITSEQYQTASAAPNTATVHERELDIPAPYAAEWVRQQLVQRYGAAVYSSGYEVDHDHRRASAGSRDDGRTRWRVSLRPEARVPRPRVTRRPAERLGARRAAHRDAAGARPVYRAARHRSGRRRLCRAYRVHCDARQRRTGDRHGRRLQVGRAADRCEYARSGADEGCRRRRARRRGVATARARRLEVVADAGHPGRDRCDDAGYRRDQSHRRRLRLRVQPVQPRAAGRAPAGFGVQAVPLFGRTRQRRHGIDDLHGRTARLRRRHTRDRLSAEERRWPFQRPDTSARGAVSVDQSRLDTGAARGRRGSGARLCEALWFRHDRLSAQYPDCARWRNHRRHAAADGAGLRDVRERRLSRRPQHRLRGARHGGHDDLSAALSGRLPRVSGAGSVNGCRRRGAAPP